MAETKPDQYAFPVSKRTGKKGWQIRFLKALEQLPDISHACRMAGITRDTAYAWRKAHPEFAEAWDSSESVSVTKLHRVLHKHATQGTTKPVWMKDAQGNPIKVDTVREYDHVLGLRMLAAHDARFQTHQGTGSGSGSSVTVNGDVKIFLPEKSCGVVPTTNGMLSDNQNIQTPQLAQAIDIQANKTEPN